MRIINAVLKWLFVFIIPLFLLTVVIQVGSREAIRLYEYNFDKYNTSYGITQSTGLEKTVVVGAARELMTYFHSEADTVHITVIKNGQVMSLFNEREQIHLKDVKGLMEMGSLLFWISLTYILLYVIYMVRFTKQEMIVIIRAVFTGSALTLGMILVFGLVAFLNPEQVFIQFHLISFRNPFWLLDPTKDYLIMMFPEDYFFDVAIFGIVTIIIEALILVSASKLLLRRYAARVINGS